MGTVELVSLENARRRYRALREEIEAEFGDLDAFRRRASRFEVEASALIKYEQLTEWEYLLGDQE